MIEYKMKSSIGNHAFNFIKKDLNISKIYILTENIFPFLNNDFEHNITWITNSKFDVEIYKTVYLNRTMFYYIEFEKYIKNLIADGKIVVDKSAHLSIYKYINSKYAKLSIEKNEEFVMDYYLFYAYYGVSMRVLENEKDKSDFLKESVSVSISQTNTIDEDSLSYKYKWSSSSFGLDNLLKKLKEVYKTIEVISPETYNQVKKPVSVEFVDDVFKYLKLNYSTIDNIVCIVDVSFVVKQSSQYDIVFDDVFIEKIKEVKDNYITLITAPHTIIGNQVNPIDLPNTAIIKTSSIFLTKNNIINITYAPLEYLNDDLTSIAEKGGV